MSRISEVLRFVAMSLTVLLLPFNVYAGREGGDSVSLTPRIHGTIRTKFEYQPEQDNSRFEVRNARVSVEGNILRHLQYKASVDLCDEGKIKMLDAYVRYNPGDWRVTLGQMRVPFAIDAHRSPSEVYFANRSFLAKQVGNVRDVGLSGAYVVVPSVKWTVEGGIFNGSGLTNQKDYWTNTYNFSFKTYATVLPGFTLEMSCQKTRPMHVGVFMWDAGAYFDNGVWHLEGEYLHKSYAHGAFKAVNAVDAFVVRNFGVKKRYLTGISALARYDFMSDHSTGVPEDESGGLVTNDPMRHRVTAGMTMHFGYKVVDAQVRLNYEQYFYRSHAMAGPSDHSKLVAELMVRF